MDSFEFMEMSFKNCLILITLSKQDFITCLQGLGDILSEVYTVSEGERQSKKTFKHLARRFPKPF